MMLAKFSFCPSLRFGFKFNLNFNLCLNFSFGFCLNLNFKFQSRSRSQSQSPSHAFSVLLQPQSWSQSYAPSLCQSTSSSQFQSLSKSFALLPSRSVPRTGGKRLGHTGWPCQPALSPVRQVGLGPGIEGYQGDPPSTWWGQGVVNPCGLMGGALPTKKKKKKKAFFCVLVNKRSG